MVYYIKTAIRIIRRLLWSFFITSSVASHHDNLKLSALSVCPEHPKAVVQLAHGMCEHKERYLPFMRFLAENGYAAFIHDHRGHGESVLDKGDLGYFYDGGARALIDDMHLITEHIQSVYPSLPLALFGHSMGSLAVRCYTKRYDRRIKALIVCGSPSANAFTGVMKKIDDLLIHAKGERSRSDIIDTVFSGAFQARFRSEGIENAWLSSDRSVSEAYNADPLCHFTFTLNGYKALLELLTDTYDDCGWKMENPSLPIRFLSGANDPCMVNRSAFARSVEHMRKVGYTNVSSRLFEGMRHEILNETEKELVYADILDFLDKTL